MTAAITKVAVPSVDKPYWSVTVYVKLAVPWKLVSGANNTSPSTKLTCPCSGADTAVMVSAGCVGSALALGVLSLASSTDWFKRSTTSSVPGRVSA